MNIVLADLPRKEQGYNLTYPSLAMTYLIAYARDYFISDGHSFYYVEGHSNLKDHLSMLSRLKPDIYGITVSAITSSLSYQTINAVRKSFPGIKIVCGGPHATAAAKHLLEHCKADVCVRGEGEVTFVELIEHFEGKKPISEIDGIAYRDESGKTIFTQKRALIKDLDSIPMPAWDLVKDFGVYRGSNFKKASPQTYVLCSRGCPFNCNFCSNPVWKENRPWVRLRSPEKIAEEVDWLYKLGVREIYLGADEFNVEVNWAEEVCDRIHSLGYKKDLFFHVDIRADRMTSRLAEKLNSINVWLGHLGIESGNQHVLEGIGKEIELGQIVDTCRILKTAGVKVFGFLMLFHAWESKNGTLNWESIEDVNNTIRFIKRLFKDKLLDYCSWQVTTPWPGSRLWETANKHNLICDTETFHGIRTMTMNLPGVSESDVKRAVCKGVLLKTYYALKSGNINWGDICRRGSESLKNVLGIGTFGGTE
ncbi:MAG: B12-binding domain-containing radical SAM protein [Candidatus Omnitrophica bacterium]|nr:B12-binding domain-containing radical SAM protein [Candidatus Omnitrophota bacterium]